LSKLALEGGQSELASLQKSVPLDLEAAERAKKQADEDLEYYVKTGEELTRKNAERMARMSQEQLEYSQEELDQLEKMYKADDLTEETEEIILLRQKREVEHAKFSAEAAKIRLDRNLEIEFPRDRTNMQNAAVRQDLALQKAKATLPASLEQKRLEVVKLEHGTKQAAEKVAKLKGDLDLMIVKAPAAGVVRYGQCDRGKWTTAAQLEPQMREGGSVMPNQTLFTIVSGDRTFIRVDVPEAQLAQCTPGKTGVAVTAGYPDARLPAKLEAVDLIAVREGVYNGRVSYAPDKTPVIVGMGVTVKLTTYSKEGAISVPSSAVFAEESDEMSRYVWIAGEKPEKRTVKVGLTKGDRIEVHEGLKADEKILLEKPKE
jgi:multidrug resistance efflux pump